MSVAKRRVIETLDKVVAERAVKPVGPVFCVDCTHHHAIPPMHYCKASPPNLVTGDKEDRECEVMRSEVRECGPEGRLFEPAGVPTPVIKYEG